MDMDMDMESMRINNAILTSLNRLYTDIVIFVTLI